MHQVAPGAGIVLSGGESMRTLKLSEFLEELRENDGSGPSATAFTFDLEFIEKNKGDNSTWRTMNRSGGHQSATRRVSDREGSRLCITGG